MANPALGTKRECPKCSAKFYDLKKNPASCPICAHEFDPEAPVKKRGKRKTVKVKADVAAERVMAAKQAQQDDLDLDDDIDLPDMDDDIGLMEDMDDDDLDDMDGIKSKPSTGGDENEDDEAFIEDEDLLEEKSLIEDVDDEEDEDEDEDDDHK